MRTILDKKQLMIGYLGVIFDSIAIYIAHQLGAPGWVALIVGFIPSMAFSRLITSLVETFMKKGVLFAVSAITGILIGAGYLFWKFGDIKVWENLPYYIVPGIVIALISMIITKRKMKKAEQRVLASFEGKNGEITVDRDATAEYLNSLKGENREITGEYEKANAVSCENGIFVGKKEDGLLTFKGIPYAKPPVGNLRWKAPQRVEPSEKVFEAFYYGKSEPQPYHNYSQAALYEMSEDCLTLNLWKSEKAAKKSPVFVWLDTYDWCTGGSTSLMDDGSEFIKENPDVLFVSLNFRLGFFGNMDFSDVPGGEAYKDSTNLGLKDQIEALRWIQRNIEGFGGDPDNVTVAGICGGGGAAVLLSTMPEAKGLFSKAVCLGGSVSYTNDAETFQSRQKEVKEFFQAKTMEDYLSLSSEQLAQATDEPEFWRAALPVRDGTTVPRDIRDSFRAGAAKEIGLLIIMAKQESHLTNAIAGKQEQLQEEYLNYLKETVGYLSEAQKQCMKNYMEKYYGGASWETLCNNNLVTELFAHYPMLNLCRAQTEAGGTGRYLVWDIESPVESIGANALLVVIALLKQDYYAEICGLVGDPLEFQAHRRMLVNFLHTGDPSLQEGEISNIRETLWRPYNNEDKAVMVLDEKGFKSDKGELSEKMEKLEALDYELYNYVP